MRQSTRFWKYQALGNTYAIIDATTISTSLCRQLCSAEYGLGTDGLLIGLAVAPARYRLQILNPDGSEAEKSGNGLRIFLKHLIEIGQIPWGTGVAIETKGGHAYATSDQNARSLSINMGVPQFRHPGFPTALRAYVPEITQAVGEPIQVSTVSMGNPHCIVHASASKEIAQNWGPSIENAACFPNRTNVQFLEVLDPNRISIHIWERGAGYTLASGSSACAAAAIAIRLGEVGHRVDVEMPGGTLWVEQRTNGAIWQSGPAEIIASGQIWL